MTNIICQVAFGYTLADIVVGGGVWTDLGDRVDLAKGIRITAGAQDELSQTQPGTMSLTLDNSDGALTPTLATSPYSPNVVMNVPIRLAEATLATPTGSAPYPLSQLSDNFDDNTVNTTVWPGNFNGATEGNGRARVPAAAGVTASYLSARQYTLTSSWSTVRLLSVPSPTGASTAQCTFMANSVTSGTRLGFIVNTVSGTLQCRSEVAFADGSAVNVTYSAVTHAWLRIRETSGTVYWETSENGSTWTVRRSLATPAWVGTDQVTLSMTAFRNAGTTDYAEFDLVGAQVHPLGFGLVNQWPVRWAGLYSTVTITATDVFKPLSRGDALRPMVEEEVLRWGPHAFYPLDEVAESTTAGDISGNTGPQPLSIQQAGSGGTLTFGATPAPLGVSGLIQVTPASSSAGKYLRGTLGLDFQNASNFTVKVEVWFATSTKGRNIFALNGSDFAITFYLDATTGFLCVESRDATGPVTLAIDSTNHADGTMHHLVYDEDLFEVWLDGISLGSGLGGIITMQDLNTLTVGASSTGTGLWNGYVGQIALYADVSVPGSELALHYDAGTTGYAGETADIRAFRFTEYARIGFTTSGSFTGGLAAQAELGNTALSHLRDIETTESGKLIASRSGPQLVLQSRSLRYNPTPAFSIAYADLEPDEAELAADDQKLINIVEVTRVGGATQRFVNAASLAANGPYKTPVDVLRMTDTETTSLGQWLLYRYAAPPPELRSVTIEAYSMPIATYRALLDADVSTPFTITGLPAEAPASTLGLTVEGYEVTIREKQHTISFLTSRTNTDAVWILDDTTYSVLGTTTRLGY